MDKEESVESVREEFYPIICILGGLVAFWRSEDRH